MANITRIKAKDSEPVNQPKPAKTKKQPPVKSSKTSPKSEKSKNTKSKEKKPFLLFRPFIALGSYLIASWRELRQVRWPNRSTTWKMVLAVFLYTLVFAAFLVALDILFDFIFSKILA